MAEIARASGLSRQTVYSHFPSRESLLTAVGDRALGKALAAIDEAMETGDDPGGQLTRLIPAWWETVGHHAHVIGVLGDQVTMGDGKEIRRFHEPILERLEDLARRGQEAGEFDDAVSPGWLASAFLGLIHTTADEVAQGRMDPGAALTALENGIPRLFGVDSAAPRS